MENGNMGDPITRYETSAPHNEEIAVPPSPPSALESM